MISKWHIYFDIIWYLSDISSYHIISMSMYVRWNFGPWALIIIDVSRGQDSNLYHVPVAYGARTGEAKLALAALALPAQQHSLRHTSGEFNGLVTNFGRTPAPMIWSHLVMSKFQNITKNIGAGVNPKFYSQWYDPNDPIWLWLTVRHGLSMALVEIDGLPNLYSKYSNVIISFFSRTRLSLRFRKRPPVWDALEIHADLPYKGRHGILPYAHQRASLNKRSPKKGVTCWTGAAYDPSLKCRPKMTKVELVHFWRPNLPIWNSDKDRPIVSIHILTLRE